MTKVILINGKARHGKDTVGKYIADILTKEGNSVLLTHYTDLLKYICKEFFGWNGTKGPKGRSLLQNVGTNVVRAKYPNYWVDFVIQMVEFFPDCWDYVVIPDTRFPNEVNEWKDSGYDVTLIKVERPDFQSDLTEEQLAHESENYVLNADYTIINNGSKNDLYDKVYHLLDEEIRVDK